jgi:hypothetical protein
LKIEGVCKAQQFIKFFLPNLNSIITTNYDLLIEYALGTKNFNYGKVGQILHGRGPYPISQWIKPVRLKGNIPVAKIHGSISWDNDRFYSDGRCGITGNALIIAPTPEKEPPKSLQAQWDLALKILRRIKHLIFFGFAFNPYDEAVLNHLKEYGQNVESVLLIDISPNIEGCKYCWPKAEIFTTKPPPEGSKFILKMYQNWII